jgi:LysR family nitrogen assimilation transcriptional regulator
MNLRQLKYFAQIVEAGNMTRAAEQLNVAQPALGMQIKQLEEELGVTLLVRHSRGTGPTQMGAVLYERALAILNLVEETRREIMSARAASTEPLRFGITPSLMQMIGSELALQMSDHAPGISLSLSEEMSHLLIETLRRGELDMILAYDVPDDAGWWKRALYQEDLVLVSTSPDHRRIPIPFAEALSEPLVLPEPRDSVRALVDRTAKELGLQLKVAHEIRSIPGIKTMILRGVAAGILPFGTVLAEVQAKTLSIRPIMDPTLRRTLYLAGSQTAGRLRSISAVRQVVRAAVATLTSYMGPLGHPLESTDN